MKTGTITLRPILIVFVSIVAFLFVMNFAITVPKKTVNTNLVACTLEAKLCPDGSAVGRHGPKCEFDPCPTTNINITANANTSTNTNTTVPSGKPTVVYALYKGTLTSPTDGQQWSTFEIIKVVDNGSPTLLTTVGSKNEQPRNYVLSPDRKWLAIDLEARAIVINLTTNKIDYSFTPARDIAGVVFSPDSKKLFIWDQRDGDNDKSYSAHSINLSSMADTVLGRGKTEQAFNAAAWRADGDVVLMHYYYPTGSIHLYNPATNKITQTEDVASLVSLISPSGKLYSLVTKSIGDVCNEYSGSAFSTFTVKDTKTGKVKGTFGDGIRANGFIAFSPDDTEVLFSSQTIPAKYEQCSTGKVTTYYRQKLGGRPVAVKDSDDVLTEWGNTPVVITSEQVGEVNANQTRVLVNGQDWHLPSGASIVKSFYTK